MFTNFIKQWRAHPFSFTLVLLGYVFGILVVSVGTSLIVQAETYSLDSTSGNPLHQAYLEIRAKTGDITNDDLNSTFESASAQAQIQAGFNGATISDLPNNKLALVGVLYQQKPEWQAPLLQGRQFTPQETQSTQHLVVMGKQLAKELFPNGVDANSTVTIDQERYHVIGLLGRKNRPTVWDEAIYLPFRALPEKVKQTPQQSVGVFITKNGETPQDITNWIIESLDHKNSSFQISVTWPKDHAQPDSQIWNSIFLTSILSGLILLVSCINITNISLFWILDRRREITIRKALGATNSNIFFLLASEVLFLAITAVVLADFLHILLSILLSTFGLVVEFHWISIIVAFTVAILCGILSSIVPVKAALKMEPADILRNE